MKLHPEDPRLTAYLLGELDAEEAAAVELAAASDPALHAALQEMENVRDILTKSLMPPPEQLLASQRAAIFQAARQADLSGRKIVFKATRPANPWIIPLAAAAAVGIAVFIVAHRNSPEMPTVSNATPLKESPAEKLTAPLSQSKAKEEAAHENQDAKAPPAVASTSPTEVPSVSSGHPSLDALAQSIRTERKLPDPASVRSEEILNSFSIRLSGVTAIARAAKQTWHPDSRDEGLTTHTATLATESLPCPWKPSATLLLISLRGNATTGCDAQVVFHPNSGVVFLYSLLGSTSDDVAAAGKFSTKLAAKSATTLAIEIEPSTPKGDLGTIEWSVNNEPAAGVTISRSGDNEPSDDARFAALVCAWSQWLAGEQSGTIDSDLLSALAREIDSSDLPADRVDFLKLVRDSLHL